MIYVAGFALNPALSRVALIRKTKPAWQAGKLNAIGGKLESGESPEQAMAREFMEETGAVAHDWHRFAILSGGLGEWSVHWFWSVGKMSCLSSPTDELVMIVNVADVILGTTEVPTIPNLRWLLPMAVNDAKGVDCCSFFRLTEEEYRRQYP